VIANRRHIRHHVQAVIAPAVEAVHHILHQDLRRAHAHLILPVRLLPADQAALTALLHRHQEAVQVVQSTQVVRAVHIVHPARRPVHHPAHIQVEAAVVAVAVVRAAALVAVEAVVADKKC
jgi:hypothetical protein